MCPGLLPKPKQAGDRRARAPPAACDLRPKGLPTPDYPSRSRLLGPPLEVCADWKEILIIVQPDTVVRWHRKGLCLYWRSISKQGPGRPRIPVELQALIRRSANENGWRARKVQAELEKLGIYVGISTVARYLPKRDPHRNQHQRWSTFLRNQRHDIAAMDCLVVPTAGFRLFYAWFVIGHGRREVLHFGVTEQPTSSWVMQQLREAFPDETAPRFLIFDNDSIFSDRVASSIENLGIDPRRTAFRSPWQNGIAERWVGIARRELLDHVIVLNEDHRRRMPSRANPPPSRTAVEGSGTAVMLMSST